MPIYLYPTIFNQSEPAWLRYSGNHRGTASGSAITLHKGYNRYILDFTGATGGTEEITIDSSGFGFTPQKQGAQIEVWLKMPNLYANIPNISFGSNIKFADFEEINKWEAGVEYCLNMRTDNGGTNWLVDYPEVYND